MRRFLLLFAVLLIGWSAKAQDIQTLHATRWLPSMTTFIFGTLVRNVPDDTNFLKREKYDIVITISSKMIVSSLINKSTGAKEA